MLRPGRLLALLQRTFTFELSPVGSPRTDVEYDYVGRQPVPTTGLPPASHAALWAAQCPLFPFRQRRPPQKPCSFCPCVPRPPSHNMFAFHAFSAVSSGRVLAARANGTQVIRLVA